MFSIKLAKNKKQWLVYNGSKIVKIFYSKHKALAWVNAHRTLLPFEEY